MVFVIVIILIFYNLFIAIIIQGYEDNSEKSHNNVFTQETVEHFKEIWSHYDKSAKGFIPIEDFPDFMIELGMPLGWDEASYKGNIVKQENYIQALNLPTYNETTCFAFTDIIENLVLL